MDFSLDNIFDITDLLPVGGRAGHLRLARGRRATIRRLAFSFSLVPLVLDLVMWFNYDRVDAGIQYETIAPWFPSIGSSYHIGVDGISLAMCC